MTSSSASIGLRVPVEAGVVRGERLSFSFDGRSIVAFRGESVAAALLAAGERVLRVTATGSPRGVFCGMGVCYDCLMVIDGVPSRRACVTLAEAGMKVETQQGYGLIK